MALNLSDLLRRLEFDFETTAYGFVHCAPMTTTDMRTALDAARDGTNAEEVVRLLFALQGNEGERRASKRAGQQHRPRIEGNALSLDEVDSFAQTLYSKHKNYAKVSDDEYLALKPGETNAELIVRVLHHYDEQEKRQMKELLDPHKSRIFGDATRNAWNDSLKANDRLRETIAKSREIPILSPPQFEHPMKGTNELLRSLDARLDGVQPVLLQAAELIANLDTTVRSMHADFTRKSVESDRKARNAEWIAIGSVGLTFTGLLLSTWFSFYQFSDGRVLNELKAIRGEHEKDRAALDAATLKLHSQRPTPTSALLSDKSSRSANDEEQEKASGKREAVRIHGLTTNDAEERR